MKTMIFISMPMRGRTDEEISDRQNAIFDDFRDKYTEALLINPYMPKDAQIDLHEAAGRPDVYLLGQSIASLSFADVALFDKGWENFPGCRIEHKVATYYDIPKIYV